MLQCSSNNLTGQKVINDDVPVEHTYGQLPYVFLLAKADNVGWLDRLDWDLAYAYCAFKTDWLCRWTFLLFAAQVPVVML